MQPAGGKARGRRAPDIGALCRVRLQSADPAAWLPLASWVGAHGEATGDGAVLRFDGGKTLEIERGTAGRVAAVGWSVPDEDTLRSVAGRIGAGGGCRSGGGHAPGGARFRDPDGVTVEVTVDATEQRAGAAPWLGHVVMGTTSMDASLRFYTEGLGLAVSDRVRIPLAAGGSTFGVFLHAADRRHHSLALIEAPPGLRHVMVELEDLDAVGRLYDRCEREGTVTRSLGRHSNDGMVSFYAAAPDPVEIEIGCGGRLVADEVTETTYDAPSVWGHRFVRPIGRGS